MARIYRVRYITERYVSSIPAVEAHEDKTDRELEMSDQIILLREALGLNDYSRISVTEIETA